MIYLYAGLGAAMLAGIMAIFEMSLALSGNSLLPTPPDPYLSNDVIKLEDRRWLTLLEIGASVPSGKIEMILCNALKSAYTTKYPKVKYQWIPDPQMPVLSKNWTGSCLLNNENTSHRVVVYPSASSMKYEYYSCVLQGSDDRCFFERE